MELLMDKKANEDYTIVIGCGRLGETPANTLSDEGGNVLIIDKYKDAFRKLLPSFGGLSITGDATDLDVLQEAQINLVICELCKKRFHVKKTVALLTDPKKTDFFYKMGIDSVVCAITAITGIIEQQAFVD